MHLYLHGISSNDGNQIHCPLSSNAILYVMSYCQQHFDIVFVTDTPTNNPQLNCCTLTTQALSYWNLTFTLYTELPALIRNVSLPCLYQPKISLVRSGLCVLLRHIIKVSHKTAPHLQMIDLLGFREGSMKMCSEVSGFTKLCEVELPQSISLLIDSLKSTNLTNKQRPTQASLPNALIKLDKHFLKKCRVHNDNKKRRDEITQIKQLLSRPYKKTCLLNESTADTKDETILSYLIRNSFSLHNGQTVGLNDRLKHSASINLENETLRIEFEKVSHNHTWLYIEHVVQLHHGICKMKVDKHIYSSDEKIIDNRDIENEKVSHGQMSNSSNLDSIHFEAGQSSKHVQSVILENIKDLVDKLSYLDIMYDHTYSEGTEMTLADLILFVYIYYLLESVGFKCSSLGFYIPNILYWANHMTSLNCVVKAGHELGWHIDIMAAFCRDWIMNQVEGEDTNQVVFVKEHDVETFDDDEMELSRCARMKHRALKSDLSQILHTIEMKQIRPVPCENVCVGLDWESLPLAVHPREGDVPEDRINRKCQQLENLCLAVQSLAKAGDIIVDFCSGGGHLGILMAYLLPDCKICLVENKEDSLLKAYCRLKVLALQNITLYQCNLDYFKGHFDIGMSLHACGSATDMVLQKCLNSQASFVMCPCCYGSIQKTHSLTYPQSKQFKQAGITYKDFLTLGHAADQTELKTVVEEQGKLCMKLVDTDRAELAREFGYTVTMCSLRPLSCTPKNNLLIGIFLY